MDQQRIAMLGTGSVGSALGARLLECGYGVAFGSRTAGRDLEGIEGHSTVSYADACRGAAFVFLAVPSEVASETVEAAAIDGSAIVVDCTNPLRFDDGPVHDPPPEGSIAAMLAKQFPELRLLKGFCTFGARRHRHPEVAGRPVDVHLAGDDQEAIQAVSELATRCGFRPLNAGPMRNAAVLENLAVLWIHLAHKAGLGREFAFLAVE